MHELFEMPKNSINIERENSFLNKYRDAEDDVQKLEEEVKQQIKLEEGELEEPSPMRIHKQDLKMYAITKKNIKRDEKL